jgi:hypothetical protein
MNPLLRATPEMDLMEGRGNLNITFIFVVVVIIFIICREIFLWYWKINTIVKNQEKTNLMIKKYIEAKGFEFTDDEKARLKS